MGRCLGVACVALTALAALHCQPAEVEDAAFAQDVRIRRSDDPGAAPTVPPDTTTPAAELAAREAGTTVTAVPHPRPLSTGPSCAPITDGPVWTEEGETVEVQVRCATGLSPAGLSFAVDDLPPGAKFDAQSGRLTWSPGLDQAATYELAVREQTTNERGTVKIGVADRFDAPNNKPIADPTKYTEEFGLPVFHLSYSKIRDSSYSAAKLVYRGREYPIEAKYRGASSLEFPKKSFTLKFADTAEFKDPLVGFGNRDKLVLVTAFNDNSYVRTRLAFEVWSMMDPEHIQVKTFSAILYVNGKYMGVYTASDHVDSDLMRRHGLSKTGNLFKAVKSDANFSDRDADGAPKSSLHQGFEKKEGDPPEGMPGAFADLDDLTRFVIDARSAEFRDGFGLRVKQREYEDWWIFVTLLLATDSPGKNAYHFHDPAGGPFRYIPWDLDASFGQEWNTARLSASHRTTFEERNELFRRMLDEPTIAEPLRKRYAALLSDQLSVDKVLAVFERLHEQTHAAAVRDERRWKSAYRSYHRWSGRSDFTDHEGEIEYMRAWIKKRWATLQKRVP